MEMIIDKGIIPIKAKGFSFIIDKPIKLNLEKEVYFITGENGVGKTSFMEELISDFFKKNKVNFSYLGQDFSNQYYSMIASLAINKFHIKKKSKVEIFDLWLSAIQSYDTLMIDEFDKYHDLIKLLSKKNWLSYFIISHNTKSFSFIPKIYKINNIKIDFTKDNFLRSIKIV